MAGRGRTASGTHVKKVSGMTHGASLAMTVEATHRSLEERVSAARAPSPNRPRDTTDAFLAATSRHLAAVEAVLVPRVRKRVPDGALVRSRVPSRLR